MKKLLGLIIALGVLWFPLPIMAADIQVLVDGQAVVFKDQSPYIDKENRTQVPLRAAMEALGCTVDWNAATKQAIIEKDGTKVIFTVGSKTYTVNGVKKTMDTTAVIAGNRTCIPIRYAAEAFRSEVEWLPTKKTVAIYTKPMTPEQKEEIEQNVPESKPEFTVATETADIFNPKTCTVYRQGGLPVDVGNTTILALKKQVIDQDRENLLLVVNRVEKVPTIRVFFDKERSSATYGNSQTGYVYYTPNGDGNYVLEVQIKGVGGEGITVDSYNEIGFEGDWGEVYYIKNPFRK